MKKNNLFASFLVSVGFCLLVSSNVFAIAEGMEMPIVAQPVAVDVLVFDLAAEIQSLNDCLDGRDHRDLVDFKDYLQSLLGWACDIVVNNQNVVWNNDVKSGIFEEIRDSLIQISAHRVAILGGAEAAIFERVFISGLQKRINDIAFAYSDIKAVEAENPEYIDMFIEMANLINGSFEYFSMRIAPRFFPI